MVTGQLTTWSRPGQDGAPRGLTVVVGGLAGQLDHDVAEEQRGRLALLARDELAPIGADHPDALAIEPQKICARLT
jgi:hypothetical protein